ncbi:MAG: hypothetical protein QM811_25230 [Pirellulales bacterium]
MQRRYGRFGAKLGTGISALLAAIAVCGPLTAAEPQPVAQTPATAAKPAAAKADEPAKPIVWETDYGTAMRRAEAEKKYLFIVFESAGTAGLVKQVVAETAKPNSSKDVEHHVFCRLPANVEIAVNGRSTRLLGHSSFSEMQGGPGIAILDLANPNTEHFRRVVNQLPFASGKYYRFSPAYVGTALSLPAGTLTQRSMIYAVRIHPEAPRSTYGDHNAVLRDEANSHSQYQAAIRNQGHHQWGSRFQRIAGRLAQFTGRGSALREVVAESWPNQGLMDSCVDCVASWRQSSGHWGAVSAPHNAYAYDIRQGSNGIWYATGLFSE